MASFQSLGTTPSLRDCLNIKYNGKYTKSLVSTNTFGCIPSGPGDLSLCRLFNTLITSSGVISISSSMSGGVVSEGSSVTSSALINTLLKKLFNTSALSLSSVATDPSDFARFPMPSRVLRLELTYVQKDLLCVCFPQYSLSVKYGFIEFFNSRR